jgi:hypothetical protein
MSIYDGLISLHQFNEASGSIFWQDSFSNYVAVAAGETTYDFEPGSYIYDGTKNILAGLGKVPGHKTGQTAVDMNICNKYIWDTAGRWLMFNLNGRTSVGRYGSNQGIGDASTDTPPGYLLPFYGMPILNARRGNTPTSTQLSGIAESVGISPSSYTRDEFVKGIPGVIEPLAPHAPTENTSFSWAVWFQIRDANWFSNFVTGQGITSGEFAHSENNYILAAGGNSHSNLDNPDSAIHDTLFAVYTTNLDSGNPNRFGVEFEIQSAFYNESGIKEGIFINRVQDDRFTYPKDIPRGITEVAYPQYNQAWPTGEWIFAAGKYNASSRRMAMTVSTKRERILRPFTTGAYGEPTNVPQTLPSGAVMESPINGAFTKIGALGRHWGDHKQTTGHIVTETEADYIFNMMPPQLAISELWFWHRSVGFEDLLTIYEDGLEPPKNKVNDSIPMFTCSGRQNEIPLFVQGIPPEGSGNISYLYTEGPTPNLAGSTTLYISGHQPFKHADGKSLYVSGVAFASSLVPLYQLGGIERLRRPLFIKVDRPMASSILPLNITGHTTGTSGIYNTTTLFIADSGVIGEDPGFGNFRTLFIRAPSTADATLQRPLFLKSALFQPSTKTTNLYLQNDASMESLDLFVRGASQENTPPGEEIPGSTPINKGAPLFINRPNESRVIPLFMKAPAAESNSFTELVMSGHLVTPSSVPLVMPNTVGSFTGVPPLYTHGF